jgi:DNA polymerase
MRVFLDFETRSKVDLKKHGQSRYARDASTEVMCLAYQIDSGPVELWLPGDPDPYWLWNDCYTCHAHNAPFEIAIFTHVCGPRMGWPVPPIGDWRCTAARCAAAGLPRSLDGASKALGLPHEKDDKGHRLMLKLSKPRRATKHDKSVWHEKPEELQRLYDYCKQDVVVERAIHDATPPLTEFEQQVWELDWRINEAGVPVDVEHARAAIATFKAHQKRLNAELKELTGGEVSTAGQTEKLGLWLMDRGVNLPYTAKDKPCLNKAVVSAVLQRRDLSGEARRAVEIRQELARSSVKKYEAIVNRADEDGRIRGVHLYCGAMRTGRWAGRGIQPQNLPRDKMPDSQVEEAIGLVGTQDPFAVQLLLGDVATALASLIRPAIRAEKGRVLRVADFAGIENRVLAWHAGEGEVLRQLRDGDDLYVRLAAKVFDRPYDELIAAVRAKDPDAKRMRQIGKVAVLGLGYGMGPEKFLATMQEMYHVDGVDLPFAERVVSVYRDTNEKTKRWWWALADAAIGATRQPKTDHTAGKITFRFEDRYLHARLPSGRRLYYLDPEVRMESTKWGEKPSLSYMGENTYTRKWERLRTYGGKLAENLVQATARDLLAESLVVVDRAGYLIVLHVHDEIVAETEPGFGSTAALERLMARTPGWAKGCPVEAEGYSARRYRKD